MANAIDIILNAVWRGGAATNQAQQSLRNLGDTASRSSVEMAAAAQRSNLLQTAMQGLGREVALGNITVEQARDAYNQYAATLPKVGEGAQGAGVSLGKLFGIIGTATAVIGTATVAARQLYTTLQEGAGLELTARRFDRLAEAAGTTGDAFRRDLRDATAGMLSDTEAMSLATDLLALDLANSAEQAVRMSRVVTELDQDIGQLTLALTNQTTKRFDQLGVSTAGFEERLEALKSTMSDEEAFTMAFLEQAEAQIEKVGGASETAAGDLARFQATSANLSDSFKVGFLGEFADNLAILGDNAEESGEKAQILGNILGTGVASGIEAVLERLLSLNTTLEIFDRLLGDLSERGLKTSTVSIPKFREEIEEAGGVAAGSAEELEKLAEAVADLDFKDFLERAGVDDETFTRLAHQLGGVNRAMEFLKKTMADAGQATDAFEMSAEELEEALKERDEQMRDRVDLWFDFQTDLSTITEREGERREEIETTWEERRSEIVAQYGQARAQEEEDWQRQRARADARLQRDIAGVQADAARDRAEAERRLGLDIAKTQEEAAAQQAELRQDANNQLAELEEDHLARMRQIIEDANLQLKDAASRLDASAVARIQAQLEQAQRRETEQFGAQRGDIVRTLEERINAERAAEAQRIKELRAHHAERAATERASEAQRIEELKARHAERQALEAEDRQIRLERQEEAHAEQLRELEDNYHKQLDELRTNSERQRQERESQFRRDYAQLVDYWGNRQEIEDQRQDEALAAIDQFWKNVVTSVPTSSAAALAAAGEIPTAGVPGTTVGDSPGPLGTPLPPAPDKPSRLELDRTALSQMGSAGWNQDRIFSQLSAMKSWSDAQLARWIEDTFGFDVPGYQMGTPFVPHTGPAILHRGEAVLDVARASQFRAGQMGSSINFERGAIEVHAAPGMDEERLAMLVEQRMESLLMEMAG